MKIEIKKLYTNERFSEETLCFQCDVYVNGKKAFTADNAGHGGCNDYHAFDGQGGALDAACTYAKSLPAEVYCGLTLPSNLDGLINEMIERVQANKIIKRILKKAAFVLGGKVMTINRPPSNIAYDWIIQRHPNAMILNTMSFNDASNEINRCAGVQP